MSKMKLNIVETWQIDPKAGPDNLEAKQPYVDNGNGLIPSEALLRSRIYGAGVGPPVDPGLADCRH